MLTKYCSDRKNKITNNTNPSDINHISKNGKMNISNYHKKCFYEDHIYKNEPFNTLKNRLLIEIHVNDNYSNLNCSSKNTSNLRPKKINKNDRKNKNNIMEHIISSDNINDDLLSQPKNLEDLIFKKRREEAHLNEGKDLSHLDKIKCFLDIFDDFFIDRMIDYSVQKKNSLSLQFITENILIHFMAFMPFSLALFPHISDRMNFFSINHEEKKKKDILHITDGNKELYGVK
ncbi:Plasmodium exported protein, unknown function [Plasmodium sp.]|nr:Plasmodium exported protein, unknown function [Plasmodium sp.]